MQIRVRLASFSLLAYLGALAGCGDDIPGQQNGGSGGSTGGSTGGSMAGAGGSVGGSTGGSVGGSVGGSTAGTGGGGTGGGGTGGSVGGTGGRGGTGGGGTGGGGTGGSVGGTGGRGGTGGGGTGGGGTGGSVGGTGGGGTGGSVGGTGGGGTGGGGTGGSTAGTGGGGTGGGGTGGGGTGGGGTGGGGTGGTACYSVTFTAPTNGAALTVANDTTNTCADGFQYTVAITTDAPAGTMVQLFNNGTVLLATATVANGAASFPVQLPSSGQSALSIQFPSTAACSVQSTVTVNCPTTPPTCTISQPTITGTHLKLNGVLAPAGDRASQIGSPYQVTFTVTTNAEDGQPVTLSYNDAATPGTVIPLSGTASGGSATFGVPLSPDATYQVLASCKNLAGITGTSALTDFPVDTAPPNLTVTQPMDGKFFGPTELDGQGRFSVCGQTTSPDAAGLPASLGAGVNNLCVALGGSASCVGTAPVTAINTNACVLVTCPGGAPFNLTVTLKDAAGNPFSATVQGVSCASTLPSVQVITPVSDAPSFNDTAKHILSATAPVGVRDQSPTTPGAQTDVVACTDRSGSAALLVGLSGGTLNPLGAAVTTVAAVASDNCPNGLGFVARFAGVTLPDSIENTNGSLATPTELRVRVTDAINPSSIGTSVPVDLWVDPVAPVLTLLTPANLCGSFQQSSTTFTQPLTFTAENSSVVVHVTNGSTNDMYPTTSFASGVATFAAVDFDPGQNDVTATETDPAGNMTTFATVPCSVFIGSAPVVTFTAPTAGQILCPNGSTTPGCVPDNDTNTAGWQGSLTVHVTGDGQPLTSGTVTFTMGGSTLGTAVALDASGNATVSGITLPEGTATILATTNNIPNRGVGTGSVTVTVDLGPPAAPTSLTAVIADRRRTSMQLAWTAPSDNGGGTPVAGYDIRYAKTQITDDTSFNAATAVTYTGVPAQPGQPDGILVTGLYIENGYFFAVKARDAGGNLSPFIGTATAVTAHFNVALLPSPSGTNQSFGTTLDGSQDVNGDGISDLLVGTFNDNHAYLFLGAAPFAPSGPTTTFTGTNTGFGATVRQIGDIDNDGRQDIAIADRPTGLRVFIYKGRAVWPAALTDVQADYVVTTDASYASSQFGSAIDRLGDFDGDGVNDFAISAPQFNSRLGRVAVIYGRAGFTSFTLSDTTRALEIGPDPALARSQFGSALTGLGHFYSGTGTTLVVSAPGLLVQPSDNAGRLYAFHGRGPGAAIAATAADHTLVGPGAGALIGTQLTNLGPVTGGLPLVGSSNLADAMSIPSVLGTAYLLSGTAATGPFASNFVAYRTSTTLSSQVLFGGGFSGMDTFVSLIGDTRPDIALAGQVGGTIDIVDGSKLSSLTSPVNTGVSADVHIPMPSGWAGNTNGTRSPIRDINNDTYPDFAIGDVFGTVPGRVGVFW